MARHRPATCSAVFFDIDGTLVDSNDYHVRAWQEAFAAAGARVDAATVHAQIGKGTDMLVPALLPNAGPSEIAALGGAQGRIFTSRYLERVRPFPRAHDLLARVSDRGMTIAFASSASQGELDHYLELLDAHGLVTVMTSADDVSRTKPAPDIFQVALDKLHPLRAADVLVIGDTPYDVEAAARCGIAAIGLRSGGFAAATLRTTGAIALYDDVAQLLCEFDGSPLSERAEMP